MRKMYILLVFIVLLGLNSCKKDKTEPSICSQVWTLEVADELDAVSVAAAAYLTDPTHETCVAYKNAYQDYLDALDPFLECTSYTAQQRADLQAAIDDAQAQLETLCDE